MKTRHLRIAAIAIAAAAASTRATWFDLDAARPRASLVQGMVPSVVGTVVDSGTHLVFGKGYYEFTGFRQPRAEPWYLVARVRIDAYGDAESWNIASLMSTASWSYSEEPALPLQGFELRVGGGRLYPQIANGSIPEQNARAASDYFTSTRNAAYSTCLLELVQATSDPVFWKETYSTRCLDKGVWHQIAAGWDGKNQKLYIDGQDVLDTNRIAGAALAPVLDSVTDLYVGHRRNASYDHRWFHGGVQSIRMVSGVLDSALAAKLYRETFPAVQGSCAAVPVVEYPLTFQYSFQTENARLALQRSPRCAEGEVADLALHAGDSIDVMAVTADAKGEFLSQITVGSLSFPLSGLGIAVSDSSRALRLKVRLRRAPVAGRVHSATTAEWNDDRPIVLGSGTLSVHGVGDRGMVPRQIGRISAKVPGATRLEARDLGGRIVVLDASRRRADGVWDLSPLPRGLWVVRGGSSPLRFVRF